MAQFNLLFADLADIAATHREAVDLLHRQTAVYTCVDVVDGLLDAIDFPRTACRLLDPGAGDGSFLVRALARLAPAPGDFDTAHRVAGVEIHPQAAAEARARINGLLLALGWRPEDAAKAAETIIQNRDFILDGPLPAKDPWDIICGNPPYLRWAHMPSVFQSAYEPLVPRDARADLLHAFLERAVRMLPPRGRIAMVTADRWMINEGAKPLRTRLGRLVNLVHAVRLDPSSAFYSPKTRRKNTPARVHPVALVLKAASASDIPSPLVLALPAAPAISRRGANENITWADLPTLADLAEVRLGPWVGPKGIFLLAADEAERRFPDIRRIPVVSKPEIPAGSASLRYPLRRVTLMPEPEQLIPASLRSHLAANRADIPVRALAAADRGQPPERVTWDIDRPGILIPKIDFGLRAIPLPPAVLPIQHNFAVYPRAGVDLEALRVALLGRASQEWAKHHAKPLERGYSEYTTTLLRRLPVSLGSSTLPSDAPAQDQT